MGLVAPLARHLRQQRPDLPGRRYHPHSARAWKGRSPSNSCSSNPAENPDERFATAPGISCFNASPAYAHGGLSLQECLIPDLLVERTELRETRGTIKTVTWRGMRCTVEGSAAGGEVRADIREGPALGKSLVASVRALDGEGRASLVVKEDRYEGAEATIVLLDESDVVLAQMNTRVGEQR